MKEHPLENVIIGEIKTYALKYLDERIGVTEEIFKRDLLALGASELDFIKTFTDFLKEGYIDHFTTGEKGKYKINFCLSKRGKEEVRRRSNESDNRAS